MIVNKVDSNSKKSIINLPYWIERENFMKDTAKEMAKRLIIDSIWKSANLEGLGTTYPKTYAILANAPTNTRAEEVIFIINMKEAWQFLLDNLDCPNNLEILLEYNKIVGNLLFYDIFLPKKPIVNNIFNDMVNKLNQIDNPEEKALQYFCFVAKSKMFINGNRRVAQLIANKILIENNIGIFQVPIDNLETFRDLLINLYKTNNNNDVISFMKKYCIKRLRN